MKRFTEKNVFICQNINTKEVFVFKGAYKMAEFIGINPQTIYNNAKKTFTKKIYNGFVFCKGIFNPLEYKNRGNDL